MKKYKKYCDNDRGPILFTYFGGNFSEGYNFSDKYARGIIMVGVPFVNTKS